MLNLFILLHFIFTVRMYHRENIFGIKSVYAFSFLIFIFTSHIYNTFLFSEYNATWGLHISLFVTTILVNKIKSNNIKIENLFRLPFSTKSLRKILIIMCVTCGVILVFALAGLGHFFRFPTIGFFSCSVFFTSFLFINREQYKKLYVNYLLLTLAIVILFVGALWSGFGRLLLLQFLTISLFFTSFIFTKRMKLIKLLVIFAVPILIGFGGSLRKEVSITEAIETGDGAGSAFSPLFDTERIYRDLKNGSIESVNGESYVAAVLFYVPRSVWTSKPVGFGNQMVKWYFSSSYVIDTGFSLAGLYVAEAIGNFSYIGFLLGPLLMYIILFWINKFYGRNYENYNYRTVFNALIALAFMAAIPDFIWGGLQPFLVRASVSALFIFLLYHFLRITNSFKS